MVKRHLKRIAAPRRWHIQRKANVFITRPNPGAHSLELGLSLNTMLKDLIKVARTTREVKGILNTKEVLVDGKRRKDVHHLVGFMDVIEIPQTNQAFRISFDGHGRLVAVKIDPKEAKLKLCSIKNKTKIADGKTQLNLSDGRNMIIDKDSYKTGDTLVIEFLSQTVKEHIPVKEGSLSFIIGGKHEGIKAKIKKIEGNNITVVDQKGNELVTNKKNIFVVGKEKEAVTISE